MIAKVLQMLRHRADVGVVAHLMVIRVVALAGNVCSGLLTAAFLGPAGRGEQAALLIAPTVIGAICVLGLHASTIYNIRADPDNGRRYFGGAILIAGASAMFGVGLGYILIPHWLSQYSHDTITLARVLLLCLPFTVVSPLFSAVLETQGQFGLANRVLYVQSLGTVVLLIGLAATGNVTPLTASVSYVAPCVPSFFYLLAQARRIIRPHLTIAAPFPARLLRYGLQFYGVDILGMLSGYLDQLIIIVMLDPADVGAYAVALSLARVLGVAQGAVATVLFPSIAAREPGKVIEMVARAARITTLVNSAGAAGLAIAGPSLLLLLYGTRFSAAVAPFLILLAEAVITSAARTLAQAFSGTGRPAVVTAVEIVGVACSLGAMLVLVPSYGIVGAACSTLIGGMARLACVLGGFRMVMGVSLPPLFVNRADLAWVTGR